MPGLGLMGLGLTVPRSTVKVILSDSFNRANGAIGSADTGQVYTQNVGTWTINANQANSDATANAVVSAQCNISDGSVQVDCVLSAEQRFVAFRLQDGINFMIAGLQSNSSILRIFSCVAGTFSEIGVGVDITVMTPTIKAVFSGSSIQVFANGTLWRQETSAQFQTQTRCGLYGMAAAFDNLLVTVP